MLHYKTVDESTLELLKQLQATELFKDLRLVGVANQSPDLD